MKNLSPFGGGGGSRWVASRVRVLSPALIGVALTVMGLGMSVGQPARAALMIGAYPLELEHQAAPGQSVGGTFQIYNGTDTALHFTTTLSDWQITPDGDLQLASPASLPRSASAWLRVSPREFDVPAKGTFTVRYSISVPAESKAGWDGEYRSMIVAQSQALPSRSGGIMIAGAVAIKVFVQVGNPVRSLAVTGVQPYSSAATNAGTEQGPSFQVEVKNTGNVHLRPVGRLEVRQGDRLLYQIPLNEAAATVLPDATRVFRATLPASLPSGEYQILAIFDYGGSKLAGGRLNYRVP